MTEIFINGQLVDTQDATVAITEQVFSFSSLGVRKGSYSNVFDLAKTNQNKALFDNCEIVTSLTSVPYQKNTCEIFVDGMKIIQGQAIIESTKETYRVFITAGNTDFFREISNTKLIDVPLTEFDHAYDSTNVWIRRTFESGFVYPNIDYGFFEHAPILPAYSHKFFQPSMWARTILFKAFQTLGYTLQGDILDTISFQNMVVLCRGAVQDIDNSLASYKTNIDYNQLTGDTEEKINFVTKIKDKSNLYKSNPSAGQFTYFPNQNDQSVNRLTISVSGKVITNLPRRYTNANVWIDLLIYNTAGTVVATFSDFVKFPDLFFGIFNIYKAPTSGTLEKNISFVFDRSVSGLTNLTDLRIGFQVRSNRPGYGLKYLSFQDLTFEINQLPSFTFDFSDGYNVEASNVLPASPTVGDLFITIANFEGIVIQVDEDRKRVNTTKIDKLITNKAKAKYWGNEKIDISENPEVRYSIDGFSQNNYFEFEKDDKDPFLNPNIGRGVLKINNVNLPTEKVLFKSKFAPVPIAPSISNSTQMGKVFTGDKYTFDGFNYNLNEDVKISEFTPRIAILSRVASSILVEGVAGGIPAEFEFDVNPSALNFQTSLDSNYKVLSKVVDNTKTVTLLVQLDLSDIQNIDFTVPVFVEYFGDYFYIEQIKQFKVNRKESTFVKLVKLGI
jgi:hypothetical protein